MDGDEDPEVEEEKAVLLGTRELEELDPAVAGSLLVARCTFGVLDMSQNNVYAIMPVIERVLDFQVLHDRWTLHTPRETAILNFLGSPSSSSKIGNWKSREIILCK